MFLGEGKAEADVLTSDKAQAVSVEVETEL